MRKFLLTLSMALTLTQCAAVEYQIPPIDSESIDAAQATLDAASKPRKSSKSFEERAALTANAVEILSSIIQPICAQLHTADCRFSFVFASDPVANAGVNQEGRIFITLDLLQYLDDEDEIATILAHEIAHHLNGDSFSQAGALQIRQALKFQLGGSSPASAISRNTSDARRLIARETAADYLAAYLLSHAGYDPAKSESALVKLNTVSAE